VLGQLREESPGFGVAGPLPEAVMQLLGICLYFMGEAMHVTAFFCVSCGQLDTEGGGSVSARSLSLVCHFVDI
jgi:hypothetical protein